MVVKSSLLATVSVGRNRMSTGLAPNDAWPYIVVVRGECGTSSSAEHEDGNCQAGEGAADGFEFAHVDTLVGCGTAQGPQFSNTL